MPIKTKRPKPTGLPGIRQDGPDRFLVVVQWIDPKTGRRRKREKVASSLAEAVKLRDQLKGRAPTSRPSRLRFSDYAEQWLAARAPRLAPSTQSHHIEALAHAVVGLGPLYVDAIQPMDIDRWMSRKSKKLAPTTINGILKVLRLAFDDAVANRLVDRNPARQVKALPVKRTRGRRGQALNLDEFRAFTTKLKEMKGKELAEDIARLILTAAWTGMRKGELLELRWSDYAEGELRVERSVWRGHVGPTKTDDPRRVAVVGPLAEVLAEQRQWLVRTQHPGLASGLMFPASPMHARAGSTRKGTDQVSWHRSPTIFDRPLRKVCSAAGVPEISAHALRRTWENLLRSAGVEDLVRRAMAGWRSEKAQAIYATVAKEEREAAAAAVVSLVAGSRIHPADTPEPENENGHSDEVSK